MNALGKQLFAWAKSVEREAEGKTDCFDPSFHIIPPVGWLNDPNGLCEYKGSYHAFYQYAPFEVNGGLKYWGHASGKDLLHLKQHGVALAPDTPYDCHGVYSGSAVEKDGILYLFYTGNIKLDGDFDYINNGREAYTVVVTSEDGMELSAKQVVLSPSDYPDNCTKHVRDPKLYQDANGCWHMVLGARLKGEEHRGAILIYSSTDLMHFAFEKTITTEKPFGFMWECPDVFSLEGQKVLSISPQGLPATEHRFQNIYQSGYLLSPSALDCDTEQMTGLPPADRIELLTEEEITRFREWDLGFDFYAPQTFTDAKGRQILIGWAGMPDADYSSLPKGAIRQHCLTIPRVLTIKDGVVYQQPIEELVQCRQADPTELLLQGDEESLTPGRQADILIEDISSPEDDFLIAFGKSLSLQQQDGVLSLAYTSGSENTSSPALASEDGKYFGPGLGRTIRTTKNKSVRNLRILYDASILEIFFNDGELVFTTRFFEPEELKITFRRLFGKLTAYRITV